jgi:aminotransferase
MRERSIVVNSLSKTFSVTGWRVGWVVAPPELTASIRKVHDFLTVGAASPLQQAGVTALGLPDGYFAQLAQIYETKRNLLLGILQKTGFRCFVPKGAYYILCDIYAFPFRDDIAFCEHLLEVTGVAAVPGSSFFSRPEDGARLIRFCFAKKLETLEAAAERLDRLTG